MLPIQKPIVSSVAWLGERVKTGFEFELECSLFRVIAEVAPRTCATLAGCSIVSAQAYETAAIVVVGVGAYLIRRRLRRVSAGAAHEVARLIDNATHEPARNQYR